MKNRDFLWISLLAALFFIPFLGGVHLFDWDEINFAECAREMLTTGDWMRPQINFEPFWEKPPLFIWLQACSMGVFGVGEFAARLPNALCGLASLLLVFKIGRRFGGRRLGWLWVLAMGGSVLPHLYFRSGIIDPWFNFLIFSGLYLFFLRKRWLSGALIGLAVLTKGPVALLIFGLTIFIKSLFDWKNGARLTRLFADFSLALLSCVAVASTWFLAEFVAHGSWFIERFVAYQIRLFTTPDAGHGGFWGYHFVVLLVGCFPASVFAIRSFFSRKINKNAIHENESAIDEQRAEFTLFLKILFWVVLILFTITKTKIVHYSSLCYFPLTFLAAQTMLDLAEGRTRLRFFEKMLLAVVGGLLGAATMALPFLGKHIDLLKNWAKNDDFALASLDATVAWSFWESFVGLILLLGVAIGLWLFSRQKRLLANSKLPPLNKKWARFYRAFPLWVIFGSSTLFTALGLIFFVKKIEAYSQRAAIEFYESKIGQPCEIRTSLFLSYAPHFYQRQQPDQQKMEGARQFFVCKLPRLRECEGQSNFVELYRKNGFVFYEKKPAE